MKRDGKGRVGRGRAGAGGGKIGNGSKSICLFKIDGICRSENFIE